MSIATRSLHTHASNMLPPELLGLERLGDAAALFAADGRCLGMTRAFDERLKALQQDKDDAGNVTDGPVPDGLNADEGLKWLAVEAPELASSITVVELGDGQRLWRIDDAAHRRTDRYLAARDTLLLRSRTLSIGEMASTLAHELNQPIGTIVNQLSATLLCAARESMDTDALSDALEPALQQARYAQNVIKRIREFTAARQPEQRQLDLRQVLDTSVELLDWLLRDARVELRQLPQEHAVWVSGDETLLQEVFTNVLRNAIEAGAGARMPDTGQASPASVIDVGMTLDASTGRVEVHIADRGPGPDGDAQVQFAPFHSSKPGGMGIGLSICRSFLELHQGRMRLTTRDGGGCVARIELPLLTAGENTAGQAGHPGSARELAS